MKRKNLLSLLLAVILILGTLSGCAGKKMETSGELPYAVNEMDVEVIDDLPDWTGDKLDLSVWYVQGTNDVAIGKTKKDDKFQSEIERAFGITFSEKTSFDNAGDSADAKVAKMVSTKAWPHVSVGLEDSVMEMLVKEDRLYDLTEMIPKYMPNFMAYINSNDKLKEMYERKADFDGKKFRFNQLNKNAFLYTDPDYTDEKYAVINPLPENHGFFYIRDDILKKIHPEAKTSKELQEIYVNNGSFTEAELTDFTISSMEDFRTLLEDISALNITENGRKVWPFYTYSGTDNWSLFSQFMGLTGLGYGTCNSYFMYYDKQEEKLMNTVKQEWFKEYVKFCNDLYRDGLASEEALIDTKAAFDQKKSNGEYAIIYGLDVPPTDDVLKAGGKDYSYRKVFIDIPFDFERFMFADTIHVWEESGLSFFKDMLTETQVEQILRFVDFMYTDAGMKFAQWGPEKAGLYTVDENGAFKYTEEKVEQAIVYDGDDQILFDYGRESFPRISPFIGTVDNHMNKFNAKLMYDTNNIKKREGSEYNSVFKLVYARPYPEIPKLQTPWNIWNFTNKVEGATEMWQARQTIEDALLAVLASRTDEEFEASYAKLIEVEERNGYDDKCFEGINAQFKEDNADYVDDFINWKKQ